MGTGEYEIWRAHRPSRYWWTLVLSATQPLRILRHGNLPMELAQARDIDYGNVFACLRQDERGEPFYLVQGVVSNLGTDMAARFGLNRRPLGRAPAEWLVLSSLEIGLLTERARKILLESLRRECRLAIDLFCKYQEKQGLSGK